MAGYMQKDSKSLDAAAMAESEKLGKLRELILGAEQKKAEMQQGAELKAQAVQSNRNAAEDFASKSGLKPGKYSVTASESGYGVNPESELATNFAMAERMDARNDRDLVHLGERLDKSNIPSQMSALANLEQGTASEGKGGILKDADYAVKSAGPIANAMPQWAKNIGESVGLMPEGASKEATLIQRLVNADIKNLSGSAVSTYEMGRQNVEKGTSIGGDPNLVKIGIKQMQDALQSGVANIKSSSRPEVVDTFQRQGGKLSLEEYLGGGQAPAGADPAAAARKARLEQLRAKHRKP